MSSQNMKTNNVGWEVDLSSIYEGTEATKPDENDPLIQPVFHLEIGEACQPNPEHLQELREGQEFKILIRRVSENEYWYLDVNGKQGHFTSAYLEFWTSQWEKVKLSSAR